MLGDDVEGKLAEACAEVESVSVVMHRFGCTVGGSPGRRCRVTATRTIGEFVHRAEMNRANGETILHGIIPTAVFGVAPACHRAVVPDVRESIAAAGWIVHKHRVGTKRALTSESQCAE